ncbi:MAG: Crp/Fnr family transcriptional regulator [Sediminicola sp.]|tara:strand:+ start:18460 stop:19083 length:624 start_codon:yes stop_codon:yes gene_type:complete
MAEKDPYKNLFIVIYFNSIMPLPPAVKSFLVDKIRSVSFPKNHIICKEGELCSKLYLIKKGMVRGYFTTDSHEITTWISSDNDIFTSITGFFRNQPARENIQALEDTHCEYLEYEDLQYAIRHFPEIRELNRYMVEEYYMYAENRAFMARIPNAQKRWNQYLENVDPKIIHRIPKRYLASLLAVRPETLSRIMNHHAQTLKGKESSQ